MQIAKVELFGAVCRGLCAAEPLQARSNSLMARKEKRP